MSDTQGELYRLGLHVEDGEGGSPDVEVTIEGDNIDELRTARSDNGVATVDVPSGSYEVVDIDANGFELDEESPSYRVENDDETGKLMLNRESDE